MIRPLILLIIAGLAFSLMSGCTVADIQVNVVSERTSLENQVLGSYNDLSRDFLLVTSVRGVDSAGELQPLPARSGDQQDTVDAIEILAFHADDIDRFKRLGWVGESMTGTLTTFEMVVPEPTSDLSMHRAFATRYTAPEFASVVEQNNAAREVLMRRVVDTNENFTIDDLPEIKKVFADLNRRKAQPGDRIQSDDGSWSVKE